MLPSCPSCPRPNAPAYCRPEAERTAAPPSVNEALEVLTLACHAVPLLPLLLPAHAMPSLYSLYSLTLTPTLFLQLEVAALTDQLLGKERELAKLHAELDTVPT